MIVDKAHAQLSQMGVILSDQNDVTRAINTSLYDACEVDIDGRLKHFCSIRRSGPRTAPFGMTS